MSHEILWEARPHRGVSVAPIEQPVLAIPAASCRTDFITASDAFNGRLLLFAQIRQPLSRTHCTSAALNGLASTSCPPRFNTSTQRYSSASREVTTRRGWCGSTCSAAKRSLQSPARQSAFRNDDRNGPVSQHGQRPHNPVAELNAREGRFRPKKRSWGEELPGDTKSNHLRGAAVCSTLVHPVNVTATSCSRFLMCPCDKPRRLRGRIPASQAGLIPSRAQCTRVSLRSSPRHFCRLRHCRPAVPGSEESAMGRQLGTEGVLSEGRLPI